MDISLFGGRVDVARYQGEVKRKDFLNTYGAKGPFVLLDGQEPVAIWTDRKTPGYPNEGIVWKLVLGGGNWRDIKDQTPLDVYRRETGEELDFDEEALNRNVLPHADFFTAVPGHVLKNPGLPKTYCDWTSIFVSELQLKGLYDLLKMPRKDRNCGALQKGLNEKALEAGQVVTPVSRLRDKTHLQFGFGDDHKIRELMMHLYGIETNMDYVPGVEVIKLDSDPEDSFENRRVVLEAYLRRDNNLFLKREVDDAQVFREREES